ncbi:MAG: hypothetical protein QOC56_693 [Alphaproteobacteria bacterium]|nr:hypothetical protein [Alphaproteobacteria bacterium]
MTDSPYKFLLNTRAEKFYDHMIGYTCVASQLKGYFRLRWHIPGHYFEATQPEANELPRPLNIGDAIKALPGCFSYGNLAKPDRSTFYADETEARRVDQEQMQGCPQTLALVRPSVPTVEPKSKSVPKKVQYSYEAVFFIEDPEKERDVSRIRFQINFDGEEKSARLLLSFRATSPEGMPSIGDRGLALRPIPPAGETDLAARGLVDVFNRRFDAPYRITRAADEILLSFEPRGEARFGSGRLGIYAANRVLSALWLPVLY